MSEYYKGFRFPENAETATEYYRSISQPVIDRLLSDEFDIENINQAMEAYNVMACIKKYKKLVPKENKKSEGEIYASIHNIVAGYASSLDFAQIVNAVKELSWQYEKDFWDFLLKYGVCDRLNGSDFLGVLRQSNCISLQEVLLNKEIVARYDTEITTYMRENYKSIELVLSHYFTEADSKIVIPQSLTQDDYDQMMNDYISSSKDRNMNYLMLMINAQKIKDLKISERIRVKAKRAYDEDWKRLAKPLPGVNMGARVGFSKCPDSTKKINKDGILLEKNFNIDWLNENLDYPTILNNFIYWFEFTDWNMRSNFCSHPCELGVFERTLGLHAKTEYITGASFKSNKILFTMELASYYEELKRRGVYLEDVLKWFFEEYLYEEFEVKDYKFRAPSHDATYGDKCTLLATEIDSVLKQFTLYVEDGYIDRQLFEMSSGHEAFRNIPSMVKGKYGYIEGKNAEHILFALFSDQSMLAYTEQTKDDFRTLYELLRKGHVNYNEYYDFQLPDIDFLRDSNIIDIEADGNVVGNFEMIEFFHDFYNNEVVCMKYHPLYKEYAEKIQPTCDFKVVDRLFSVPEQSYLNYVLNKEESTNGLDLRNSYCHGTSSLNEDVNRCDYYELLKVLILIVIKINEEFCLK